MTTVKQNQAVLWVQEAGKGTPFVPLGIGEEGASMTGKSLPIVGVTPRYGRDRYGSPILASVQLNPPGDLPGATIQVYDTDTLNFFEKLIESGCTINVQIRYVTCGILDNPALWDKIQHWGRATLQTYTPGDAPTLDFNGEDISSSGTLSFEEVLLSLVQTQLTSLTTSEPEPLVSVVGIPDKVCEDCGNGYPGADTILYAAALAGTGATANILFSRNGGASWGTVTTDPLATDVDPIERGLAIFVMGENFRLVVAAGANPATAAQIAYADIEFGQEDTATWTLSTVGGTTNDPVGAILWSNFSRMYASVGDLIYLSENQGASFNATEVGDLGATVTAMAVSPNGKEVWAVGASNAIAVEMNGKNGFSLKTGPTGGGSFTAVAISTDGDVYAGNGTSIYVTRNRGKSASSWDSLKNFGAGYTVKKIQIVKGISQLLRVVVDHASGGQVWESVDGGSSWRQVTPPANEGLKDAYWGDVQSNYATLAGTATGTSALLLRLQP